MGQWTYPIHSRCGHFIGVVREPLHHMPGSGQRTKVVHIVGAIAGITIWGEKQGALQGNGGWRGEGKTKGLKVTGNAKVGPGEPRSTVQRGAYASGMTHCPRYLG